MKDSIRIGRSGIAKLQSRAHAEDDLLVWTIYDHPKDFPDSYVVRPHSTKLKAPLTVHYDSPNLETLRAALIEVGLVQLGATREDDPCILETWI